MEEPGRLQCGVTKSRMRLSNFTFTFMWEREEKQLSVTNKIFFQMSNTEMNKRGITPVLMKQTTSKGDSN